MVILNEKSTQNFLHKQSGNWRYKHLSEIGDANLKSNEKYLSSQLFNLNSSFHFPIDIMINIFSQIKIKKLRTLVFFLGFLICLAGSWQMFVSSISWWFENKKLFIWRNGSTFSILFLWRGVKNNPKTQIAVSQILYKPHWFYLHILKGNYV